eukprot:NODE_382_length_9640_cov_0.243476.p4 type:complete len:156 gc:universal NODE_382_length_9640_cov_0.243476:1996-2463(+)
MEIIMKKSIEEHLNKAQLDELLDTSKFNLITHLQICGTIIDVKSLDKLVQMLEQSKTVNTLVLNRNRLNDDHLKILLRLFQVQQIQFDKKKRNVIFSNPSSLQIVSGATSYHILNGYIKVINLAWNEITDEGHYYMKVTLDSIPECLGAVLFRSK